MNLKEKYENIYLTSDLHLWHKNIIKYCNRPYEFSDEGALQMNEDILKEFDKLPSGSLIINNGDLLMGFNNYNQIFETILRMKQNNKKLWFIMGNHDRDLNKFLKLEGTELKALNSLTILNSWFDFVSPVPILIDNKYLFSHEPLEMTEDNPYINVYGHTHDKDYDINYPNAPANKYINICWDKNHRFINYKELGE